MTRIVDLNEIVTESVIIRFGDIDIDVSKIPAYYSFCLIDFAQRQKDGKASPNEAIDLTIETIQSVCEKSREEILKAGNSRQFVGLILALASELMKTYEIDAGSGGNPLAQINAANAAK